MRKNYDEEKFAKVIALVEQGINIYEALKFLNIEKGWFYKCLSAKQRAELQIAKTIHTEFGVGYYGGNHYGKKNK